MKCLMPVGSRAGARRGLDPWKLSSGGWGNVDAGPALLLGHLYGGIDFRVGSNWG